jgi:hypothetical protein
MNDLAERETFLVAARQWCGKHCSYQGRRELASPPGRQRHGPRFCRLAGHRHLAGRGFREFTVRSRHCTSGLAVNHRG